jgi:two-component system chemotaxis sensor kinase CheA
MNDASRKNGPLARTGLRAKLIRAMVVTLFGVSGATLLTVGYISYRSARASLETIETHIRQSIERKGQGLATNHALALRGLASDNAFGDIARLVERAVGRDDDVLYGLFLSADGHPWAYVAPSTAGRARATNDFTEIGVEPSSARRPGAEAKRRRVFGLDVFEFSASVDADDGTVLGRIYYGLSSVPLQQALAVARHEFERTFLVTLLLLAALGVGATMAGIAIIRGVAGRITRPLAHLTEVTTAIAGGRKDERVSIGTDDEIGVLGRAFNKMLEELEDSYKSLESLNRTLEHRVEERTRELGQRNRDMRLVLDNVDQGFLTMSREGILAEERSAIVTRWFGPSAPNQSFVAYMAAHDPSFAEAFQLGYEALLEETLPFELCISQLPSRLRVGGRELAFSYHPIFELGGLQGLLIVVNDISEQIMHARQEAERSELLAMVQGFMRDRSGFLGFFDEGTHLLEVSSEPATDVVTRKRLLHTLKGNAALAGFQVVADLCHQVEDRLAEAGQDDVEDIIGALKARWQGLSDNLAALLGERGWNVIEVPSRELEATIDDLRAAGVPAWAYARLGSWKLEPTERPLGRLARYGRSLAQRLGKGELQVDIDGGGVRLDPQRWKGLWSELVHVVRNAVDHGMESPEERQAASKAQPARLWLRTTIAGDHLCIDVEDDGRGIDWAAIRRVAGEKGLPHASQEDLTAALLAPDVTTRDRVTVTSGRGIGLSSVAELAAALGGSVAVTSQRGAGTLFRLTLPLAPPKTINEAPPMTAVGNMA